MAKSRKMHPPMHLDLHYMAHSPLPTTNLASMQIGISSPMLLPQNVQKWKKYCEKSL
ncbi:MAG: hypothetical protein LBH25_01925 [Fibromonadaceae bacterium]|nr:hypothetical protein [Fibromonadaceae bacterium]